MTKVKMESNTEDDDSMSSSINEDSMQNNNSNHYSSDSNNFSLIQSISRPTMLVSLDGGIHSGVPTRTTATLTPTTLRNIEQTFLDLTNEQPTTIACQAGFVAPLPSFPFDDQQHDQESMSSNGSGSSSSWQTPPPSTSDELLQNGTNSNTTVPSKRNMGGRRPKNASNMTPAEEEKRKVRRERNKLAAARCRKRRVDQTNDLMDKVTGLEKEKEKLQNDIHELQALKEELQFCLDSHRAQCRLLINNSNVTLSGGNDRKSPLMEFKSPSITQLMPQIVDKIKIEPHDSSSSMDDCGPPSPKRILLTNSNPIISTGAINHHHLHLQQHQHQQQQQHHNNNNNHHQLPPVSIHHQNNNNNTTSIMTPTLNTPTLPTRPNRPSSLAVPFSIIPSHGMGQHKNIADMAGVSITTPSNGVIFNFDSLMDGGTGLTPVSQPLMPNCSSMNRNPLDLATPTTEPSKLVSL